MKTNHVLILKLLSYVLWRVGEGRIGSLVEYLFGLWYSVFSTRTLSLSSYVLIRLFKSAKYLLNIM